MRLWRALDDLWRELRYASLALARNPSFTAASVVTLAVGIGAATTIFSVADAVLLEPLRFPEADRLLVITEPDRPPNLPRLTFQEYAEWRERTVTLSGLAASSMDPQLNVRTSAGTARITAGFVSGNYFDVLGVRAALGRAIGPADEAAPGVAVLSFDAWSRLFQRDPEVIGRIIEGRSGMAPPRVMTIVGIMPEGMEQAGTAFDLYAPIQVTAGARSGVGPIIGRLARGVTLAAAVAEANALGSAIRPARPATVAPLTRPRFEVTSLKDTVVASLGNALRVFLVAVTLVMAIVCANVASLVLARGTARHREIAVRLALGASRGRVIRHLATEAVLLAVAGGVLGAALAAAGVKLVTQLATVEAEGVFKLVFGTSVLPRARDVDVDLTVLVTAFALAAGTSVVCGLLPAWRLSRIDHAAAMGVRGGGALPGESGLRSGLVVAQVALATALLMAAALLVRSFANLQGVDKGYDPEGVVVFQLVLPEEHATARKIEAIGQVLSRVRALPGVSGAGFAYAGVLIGVEDTVGTFVPPGRSREEVSSDRDRPRLKSLSPGYLEAVGSRLVAGRWITEADATSATPAVLVNQLVARRYFDGARAVGAFLDWHGGSGPPTRVQIVGVVADIREGSLARQPYAEVFLDYRQVARLLELHGEAKRQVDQIAFGFMSFAARAHGDPRALIAELRDTVAAADPQAGLDAIAPLDRLLGHAVARQRFYAVLLGGCAAVAALLALIGIYGLLAYAVAQRTREIGVRVALGARPGHVLRMVLGSGMGLATAGVMLGLAGAAAAARYLEGMLFGVTALDVPTFVAVAIVFLPVALLASGVPAQRALQVDPAVTLRHE